MTNTPKADSALSELNNMLSLAQCKPGGSDAFNEFCKLGLPVIVCDVDQTRASGATDDVVCFKVNEALVAHMAAFVAPYRKYFGRQWGNGGRFSVLIVAQDGRNRFA